MSFNCQDQPFVVIGPYECQSCARGSKAVSWLVHGHARGVWKTQLAEKCRLVARRKKKSRSETCVYVTVPSEPHKERQLAEKPLATLM